MHIVKHILVKYDSKISYSITQGNAIQSKNMMFYNMCYKIFRAKYHNN